MQQPTNSQAPFGQRANPSPHPPPGYNTSLLSALLFAIIAVIVFKYSVHQIPEVSLQRVAQSFEELSPVLSAFVCFFELKLNSHRNQFNFAMRASFVDFSYFVSVLSQGHVAVYWR